MIKIFCSQITYYNDILYIFVPILINSVVFELDDLERRF